MSDFKKGDRVSYEEYQGVVWKVTDKAVHVRYDNELFQKFHFNPTHHMQTPIAKLIKIPCSPSTAP